MKINIDLQGEQELSRRLVALAEMPALEMVLDDVAEQSRSRAQQSLIRSGHGVVADSLQITKAGSTVRHVTATHPAAWHADAGTMRAPGVRWRQIVAGHARAKLKRRIADIIRRRLRQFAMRST